MNAYTVKAAVDTLCKWNADKELIVDGNTRYCGEQLNRESRALAQALLSYGIGKGDTVALLGTASCAFYGAYFGAHKVGAVTCNIHIKESAGFISRTLAQIDASLVICSPNILATVGGAVQLLQEKIPVLVLDTHTHGNADGCYAELLQQYPAREPDVDIAPGDDAIIILSSGSTGTPKGIVHSQANFVRWLRGAPALFGAVSRNTRFLVNVGTSFAAWPFSSLPIIYAGGTIVLMEGFTPQGFCEAVEREKITMAGPVPTMIRMLDPTITQNYDLSSFEMVLCAGEPPTLADIERVLSWADTDIRCLYLASESAPCAATYWELSDLKEREIPVCAGKPVAGADLRIVNPDGDIDDKVPHGESGEILLRGPTLATRYLKNPELTDQRFVDGWWRSGDIGHVDAQGFVFVEGRTDNTINTGGIKVHGEEVENCLLLHPDIAQVAVIGCPDPKWGQRIEAHIATTVALTDEALTQFCEQQGLAAFKRPKRYVFHTALPVGVTGKLDRVILREKYR